MTSYETTLTAIDVARILNIGRNSVYELAKSGELKSYRMGRKLLFTLDDVNEYFSRISGHYPESITDSNTPSDIQDAISPLTPKVSPIFIAGEGSSCGTAIGLLRENGLTVSQQTSCDYAALAMLYSGKADAAITTLYDRKTNTCNTPFVQRLVPGTPVAVIRIATHPMGALVKTGNPKKIVSWGTLFQNDVTLANRPRGTAERVLLDEKIVALEMLPRFIKGYDNEIPTSSKATTMVSQGLVDACIGTAHHVRLAPNVQFVPLQMVSTDLIVLKNDHTRTFLQDVKNVLSTNRFKKLFAETLPFSTDNTGVITYEL